MHDRYTVAQAAEKLQVAVITCRKWCKRLGVPKFGPVYSLTDADIERLHAAIFADGKRLPESGYIDG